MIVKIQDVMTKDPASCTPQTRLQEVAQMMVAHDCGSIPVVDNPQNKKLVGIITDRDIVCRAVACGQNPAELTAGECMSQPVITAMPEASLSECCELMEQNQVRRIAVVGDDGRLSGVITQAHIAQHGEDRDVAEVMKDISQKSESASRVTASTR